MKLALLILVLCLSTSLVMAADKVLDDLLFDLQLVPLEGQTPPPFELERLGDGKKVTLAEHRGRPVLLYFWATW
jgi:cytochrome oxidase Cu insertion factor (SCO1/SenC/PrrC family)